MPASRHFLLPSTRGGRAPRGARCLRSHRYVPCDRHVRDACEAPRIPLRSGMHRLSALLPRLFSGPGLLAPAVMPAGDTVAAPGGLVSPGAGNRSLAPPTGIPPEDALWRARMSYDYHSSRCWSIAALMAAALVPGALLRTN